MLVILPLELASSYNDCLPSALVPRCNASSTRQRAQGNTRRAHLSLKCFASTDADTSPPHPAGLLLLRMALFQNSATTAVRLPQTPLANVGTSSLPLTHTRAPTCAQPPAGPSRHSRQQQRRRCITSYTSIKSRHAHAQHLNEKCKSGPT